MNKCAKSRSHFLGRTYFFRIFVIFLGGRTYFFHIFVIFFWGGGGKVFFPPICAIFWSENVFFPHIWDILVGRTYFFRIFVIYFFWGGRMYFFHLFLIFFPDSIWNRTFYEKVVTRLKERGLCTDFKFYYVEQVGSHSLLSYSLNLSQQLE